MTSGNQSPRPAQAPVRRIVPVNRKNGAAHAAGERPTVQGKFLFVDGKKFLVKGVTYGTFRPDEEGRQFPAPEQVESDFSTMAAYGINAVRVYTAPPIWLLDLAHYYGLYVMVGLAWEQHVAFLDDRGRAASIEDRVRRGVRDCEQHPAVLCYVIGNEIPSSVVRWHGPKKIQRFLKRLYDAAKSADPEGLVTYVNFPTTEYLQLPFLDLYCFNVYLEVRERLEDYLARLQNLADTRPLVMAEIGLDSRSNGEAQQADTLAWQIETAFASGCAGMFVYAWTDEWYISYVLAEGGFEIEDWDFGLTDRDRRPKPALEAVAGAFSRVPFPSTIDWPSVSVVVCSLNGSRTIGQTLDELGKLDYPNYEVIVINDGSTDSTGEIAGRFDVHLITVENGGLSRARNLGLNAATGDIVAYIDDDAYPDPHWLKHLAYTFQTTDFAAVGGPNIPPPGDGWIAECVANSPGGPIHVLTSDREAEHIPGCNMAFRRPWLEQLRGFDPQFRAAGDDVDLCWRLMEAGGKIGFNAAAVVWHHRRNSVRTFWKQQVGYGRAEALLEAKWPEKYNSLGHASWMGRIYSDGMLSATGLGRSRIYFGYWGLAPFQGIYQSPPGTWSSITQTPEWILFTGFLLLLSGLGLAWPPLAFFLPVAIVAAAVPFAQVLACVKRINPPVQVAGLAERLRFKTLTTALHVMQPTARLWGRLRNGLTPNRVRGVKGFIRPKNRHTAVWSEDWHAPEYWLETVRTALRESGAVVRPGGPFDPVDLEIRGDFLASARVLMCVEEHGAGRQLIRFRSWPQISRLALAALFPLAGICLTAGVAGSSSVAVAAAVLTVGLGARLAAESGTAVFRVQDAVNRLRASMDELPSDRVLGKEIADASATSEARAS